MKKITFTTEALEYKSAEDLDKTMQKLVNAAREATQRAYAPYSNFKVGAAVLLDNGKIITGNNQENGAYPSGLCAERVAVFAAAAQYPDAVVKAVAIAAFSPAFTVKNPVTPCGACRQVLAEYENKSGKPIKVYMTGNKGKVLMTDSINTLLPFSFDASGLLKIPKK
ncbi:MAG: Cytidine deaminase [Bacteroidetes bacterium ADurb.Bin408]|nr:MAG: Cytidine deaminase [Bacteroidetes bacterium ADurb.Bin408]